MCWSSHVQEGEMSALPLQVEITSSIAFWGVKIDLFYFCMFV